MKRMLSVIVVGLVFLTAVVAHANSPTVFPGEIFAVDSTFTQTTGTKCCPITNFIGSFTIGTMVPGTTDWTVTAFNSSSLVWNFSSIQFDASNDTFFGTASAPFTGGGGDSRLLTLFAFDGNTSTDTFTNQDLNDPTNDRAGILSYTVSEVPEPSTLLLMSSGAFGIIGVMRRRFRA